MRKWREWRKWRRNKCRLLWHHFSLLWTGDIYRHFSVFGGALIAASFTAAIAPRFSIAHIANLHSINQHSKSAIWHYVSVGVHQFCSSTLWLSLVLVSAQFSVDLYWHILPGASAALYNVRHVQKWARMAYRCRVCAQECIMDPTVWWMRVLAATAIHWNVNYTVHQLQSAVLSSAVQAMHWKWWWLQFSL